tara:strand:- start:1643 stop:2737 length:1095 start_codon:yes stop_codon:yes gene_type:complete
MMRAVQKSHARFPPQEPGKKRGRHGALAERLLAMEPEVLPPPIASEQSKTGYFGVSETWRGDHSHRGRKPYQARVYMGRASWLHLGSYETAEEAARHSAAAREQMQKDAATPPHLATLPARRKKSNFRVRWEADEDAKLRQILAQPEFAYESKRANPGGHDAHAYWKRVAVAMGYEDTTTAARRCNRRWYSINPEPSSALGQAKMRARAKSLTSTFDSLFENGMDENPFETVLQVDAQPVADVAEEAQNVIVRLSQFRAPMLPCQVSLYADEALSDTTVERGSVGDPTNLHAVNELADVQTGRVVVRSVKRTTQPARSTLGFVSVPFRSTNLGRVGPLGLADLWQVTKACAQQRNWRRLRQCQH